MGVSDETKGGKQDFLTAVRTVGAIVEFGHYEQDNDLENGQEPIEWIVLDVQEEKSLIISKYGLDCKPYNKKKVNVTWKTSSLRQWLYEDFPSVAFTPLEQDAVLLTEVDNSREHGNPEWNSNGGPNSQDRVFLLSYAEAEQYFASDDARICSSTEYAKEQGAYTDNNGNCWWWLRSPGYNQKYAADVYQNGDLGNDCNVSNNTVSIRPALWLSHAPTPTPTPTPEPSPISVWDVARMGESEETEGGKKDFLTAVRTVGEVVEFGHYEQDNDLENGQEPIEWIVLDVQDGKSLIISKYGLDCKPFNEKKVNVTWKTSSLRQWLYKDFYEAAFTPLERDAMLVTDIGNGREQGNPEWSTDGGPNAQDRIFLLSYAEAESYFTSNDVRICRSTEYAKEQGAYTDNNGNCWWWLRSPGYNQKYAADVYQNGDLGNDCNVSNNTVSIRPALWLSHERNVTVQGKAEAAKYVRALEEKWSKMIGSFVTFGSYEQDNDLTNGPEPIEWIVLDVQDGKALLISRYGLDSQCYNNSDRDITWEKCTLRTWLNQTFLQTAFSAREQQIILVTDVDNKKHRGQFSRGGNDTRDQVFLLSSTEVFEYFYSDADKVCVCTAYAEKQGVVTIKNGNCRWWLRSPGHDQSSASVVYTNGSLSHYDPVISVLIAVRPAMWIDLNSY